MNKKHEIPTFYGSVDAYLTTYFMLYVQFDLLAFEGPEDSNEYSK